MVSSIFLGFIVLLLQIQEGTPWCTGGYRNIGGTCYLYNQEKMSWSGALTACTRDNSTLVKIPDNDTDASLTRTNETEHDSYWIGLRRVPEWKWLDGKTISTYFWGPRYPHGDGKDDRLAIRHTDNFLWNDVPGNQKAHCICQIHRTSCGQVRTENNHCHVTKLPGCTLVDNSPDCFFLSNYRLVTWTECRKECSTITGFPDSDLAIIDGESLLNKVRDALRNVPALSQLDFWIGGFLDDINEFNIWNNNYNDVATYTAWWETPGTHHCAVINATTPGWMPTKCDTHNKFICQKDQTCTPEECVGGACNTGTCVCRPGWTGEKCDKDVNECSGDGTVCNHGWCENSAGSYTCDCYQGWTGKLCDTDVNECITEHQHHCYHGHCSNVAGSYKCICNEGWTGVFCFEDANECEVGSPHCIHGTCTNSKGNYSCSCHHGWKGRDCDADVNECEVGSPYCIHGECRNIKGNYSCSCHHGWKGRDCEIDVNECELGDHYCTHGTCRNIMGSYSCTCHPGWTGTDCHTDINECGLIPSRCLHGNCTNTAGDYHCDCMDGWTGWSCAEEGHCPDLFNRYQHKCFRYVPVSLSWTVAESQCRSSGGGHLVIVKSLQDSQDAYNYVLYTTGASSYFWMDAEKQSGVWRWHTTKENMVYTNWPSGQPGANRNCTYLSGTTMISYSCSSHSTSIHLLCEAEMITHTSSKIVG